MLTLELPPRLAVAVLESDTKAIFASNQIERLAADANLSRLSFLIGSKLDG